MVVLSRFKKELSVPPAPTLLSLDNLIHKQKLKTVWIATLKAADKVDKRVLRDFYFFLVASS